MKNSVLTPFTNSQTRIYQDAAQVAEAHAAAALAHEGMGWMTWKASAGRDYLFHGFGREGKGKSLGVRSVENEARLAEFSEQKEANWQRLQTLRAELLRYSKYIKAERLNRMPLMAGKVINLLDKAGVGSEVRVIGTNSLYAYEALGSVLFAPDVRETRDLDILWDARRKLEFTGDAEGARLHGFSAILRKADKTFTVSEERRFTATNASGYAVDFLMPEPDDGRKAAPRDTVRPMGLVGQAMLNEAAVVSRTVFLDNGMPCFLRVVDPRIFVLHKLWVARKSNRNPGKARRDLAQAAAVRNLIEEHLPMFAFDAEDFAAQVPAALQPIFDEISLSTSARRGAHDMALEASGL